MRFVIGLQLRPFEDALTRAHNSAEAQACSTVAYCFHAMHRAVTTQFSLCQDFVKKQVLLATEIAVLMSKLKVTKNDENAAKRSSEFQERFGTMYSLASHCIITTTD